MKSNIKITGNVKIYKDGILIREINNLVVDSGLSLIAARILGGDMPEIDSIAVGTGLANPTNIDTALQAQLGPNANMTSNHMENEAIITANISGSLSTGTITEAGLFSRQTLFARTTFSGIILGIGEWLQITWIITITGA